MKPITTIVGRLGKKITKSVGDHTVTNFSIAVNELVKNNDNGYDKKTHWFNCEAWNAKSKIIENHISVGQHFAITAVIENNISSSDPKYIGSIKFIVESISFEPISNKLSNGLTNKEIPFNEGTV